MKKWYEKTIRIMCILFLGILCVQPLQVHADTGPKPSVIVEIEGIEDEIYYVTLLSEKESTGPWSAGGGYEEWYENEEVWEKFNTYVDTDGFYFLGCYENCTEANKFAWTYYPPATFKILIYFPETDRFIVSGIYERYAFDSYFTMKVSGEGINEATQGNGIGDAGDIVDENAINADRDEINVSKSYDYTWESISLVCRILITILIEMAIALIFGFRNKKQLLVIMGVNILTQTILNIVLNLANYYSGSYAFVFHYIWIELLVFVIEGIVYTAVLHRMVSETQKKGKTWGYAFCANVFSLVIGLWIANLIPGIF